MEMRRLGRTGLKVAVWCLGSNVFGRTCDDRASQAVLDAYVEGGGNFIDTADIYSKGESEAIIGRWLAARGNRDQMVIATKVANALREGSNERGLSRRRIMAAVEESLQRLQTDYIDLYQAHWDDRETPLEESLRAFDDLVRQGKVLYVGASNYSAWRLTMALWASDRHSYARYECLQPHYNLVHRSEYEQELEPLCREQEIGVIPYFSLASGFLTGKYRADRPLPDSVRAQNVQKTYMNEKGFRVLAALDEVAASHHINPAQVALAWLAARPGITAPIASATSPDQVRELLGFTELRLDAASIEALDRASGE
jgi:aryl-alcohol dehydrogenase-like predicted oxidoreductase